MKIKTILGFGKEQPFNLKLNKGVDSEELIKIGPDTELNLNGTLIIVPANKEFIISVDNGIIKFETFDT